jgi:aldose 1-epimerase
MRRVVYLALASTAMSTAANYTAERITIEGQTVLKLADAASQVEVLIAPAMGNNAYSMKVKGQEIFFSPYKSFAEWVARPGQIGNPFLAPWANRIAGDGYYVNGKRYLLNAELGSFRKDANGYPIHGTVVYAKDWEVTALRGGDGEAVASSRLVYHRDPARAAQFPFAHTIEMTYRLSGGALEVATAVENQSGEAMPVLVGYHTYYTIPGVPRDEWKVRVAAREHVVLSDKLTPTGEVRPVALANPLPLRGTQLDDVFTGLELEGGKTAFWVEGGGKRITVDYGPNYTVSVIYAPAGREFICFEPMTGVTNQFNLAHEGKFARLLQKVAPGGRWRESFTIRATGF